MQLEKLVLFPKREKKPENEQNEEIKESEEVEVEQEPKDTISLPKSKFGSSSSSSGSSSYKNTAEQKDEESRI